MIEPLSMDKLESIAAQKYNQVKSLAELEFRVYRNTAKEIDSVFYMKGTAFPFTDMEFYIKMAFPNLLNENFLKAFFDASCLAEETIFKMLLMAGGDRQLINDFLEAMAKVSGNEGFCWVPIDDSSKFYGMIHERSSSLLAEFNS